MHWSFHISFVEIQIVRTKLNLTNGPVFQINGTYKIVECAARLLPSKFQLLHVLYWVSIFCVKEQQG